jgi:hypothetical protein
MTGAANTAKVTARHDQPSELIEASLMDEGANAPAFGLAQQ